MSLSFFDLSYITFLSIGTEANIVHQQNYPSPLDCPGPASLANKAQLCVGGNGDGGLLPRLIAAQSVTCWVGLAADHAAIHRLSFNLLRFLGLVCRDSQRRPTQAVRLPECIPGISESRLESMYNTRLTRRDSQVPVAREASPQ